jgi:hypothetical protein
LLRPSASAETLSGSEQRSISVRELLPSARLAGPILGHCRARERTWEPRRQLATRLSSGVRERKLPVGHASFASGVGPRVKKVGGGLFHLNMLIVFAVRRFNELSPPTVRFRCGSNGARVHSLASRSRTAGKSPGRLYQKRKSGVEKFATTLSKRRPKSKRPSPLVSAARYETTRS